MKIKLLLYIVCFSLTCTSFGQLTAPYNSSSRIIPPSPEAISLNQVGFSDVSLYTGKMNYGIPLYTIEQNGFNYPVSLAYVGGGGIKVEEVASSAGLGWSLNATGVVSRVIRGLADDTHVGSTYIGYLYMPEVPNPTPTNYETYHEYARNRYDGQPDLFNLSVPGVSAQFYIGKDKKVIFLDKTDIKIDPVFSGYELVAFKMKDLNGRTYYFEAKEQSKSIVHESAPAEFSDFATSSWYLTKVESEYGKQLLSFEYSTIFTNQVLRSPFQYRGEFDGPFAENNTTWSTVYTYKCNLNKIVFGSGEVNFIMSDSVRYDLNGDKWIKQIVVKNINSDTIKNYQFYHSYYPSSENVYRLKLDSLKDFSLQRAQSQTYRFTYDTSHELPNPTTSFAMDHWGYYNGQNTNASWEAKNRVKYYRYTDHLDSTLEEFGSANRAPDLTYAQTGVLTKVTTPTGGQIKFNYELHTSADSLLPNPVGATNFFATLDFQPNYFKIDLTNEPFGYVRVQSSISYNTYSFVYEIRDSLQAKTYFMDTLKYGNTSRLYKLEKGSYCIIVKQVGAHPDPSYNHFTRVYVDQETKLVNKFVGGLRIRSMEMIDPAFGTNLVRNYYYNEDGNSGNSRSTGTIGSLPSYGMQRIDMVTTDPILDFWSYYYVIADGYYRTLASAYPIGVTSGSNVGYGKVTTVDSNALKTEYQFTSFKDFPEYNEGLIPNSANSLYQLTINGKTYQTQPYTPADERDFLRGKLKRQIVYEKKDTVFRKLTDTENTYGYNMGYKTKNGSITVVHLPDTTQSLTGMVLILEPNLGGGEDAGAPVRFKKYYLYTTSYALKKTVTRNYSYQPSTDSLVSETNFYYEDSPWFKDSLFHFLPTKTITTTSKGKETIKNYYPYHWRYTIPESTSPDLTAYKTLDTLNRIGVPVVQVKEDSASASHLVTVKNGYSALVGNIMALNKVSKKDGSGSLREIIALNQYDTLGNVLEQQKTNDMKESYIWDYKNSYPIAQVTNASYSSIAFTSFESTGKGNWTYSGTPTYDATSPTGKKAFTIVNSANNITKSGLSTSTTYIVSYWKKSGTVAVNSTTPVTGRSINGWTYYEHTVVNPSGGLITVSGTNGVIDELRLYPAVAQMITYTYTPLIGMTSQCDANNRITYYEYDNFNRLSLVRDGDKNILKKICYNYAGQPEDCGLIVYSNVAKSGNFTRNNCGTNGTGGTVTYNIAAGTYTSTISQADADQKAINAVNAGGQAYANANAGCTWISQAQSGNFTRNNCGTNGTGGTVTYTIAAGTYNSTISLADANQKATNAVNSGGQAYANANAGCTWTNQVQSASFTRNNCATGGVGGTVTYTVAAGGYSSAISLADANLKATNAVNSGGQAYANANASCTWMNQEQIRSFTRNNCSGGLTGSGVDYTIPANTHSSTISQADANLQAYNAATTAGQAYANLKGFCYCYCPLEGQSCVYDVCETGVKVYTTSVYNSGNNTWTCYYHYEFSDGSWTADYSEVSSTPCYQP